MGRGTWLSGSPSHPLPLDWGGEHVSDCTDDCDDDDQHQEPGDGVDDDEDNCDGDDDNNEDCNDGQLQPLGNGDQDASQDRTNVRQHSEVPEANVTGWLRL